MEELSKKTYTKVEVDKLLFQLKREYDDRMREQKNRIFKLLEEIEAYRKETEKLKARDAMVSSALLEAAEKAKQIQKVARRKSRPDIEKLQGFIARCEKYLSEIKLSYPLDGNIKKFEEFTYAMKSTMPASDEIAAAEFNPKEKIDRYIQNDLKAEDTPFDLNEVLYPKKELDLEELCRQLGLMD